MPPREDSESGGKNHEDLSHSARHGRTFSDDLLQGYFNSKPWYRGMYSPANFDNMKDGLLNTYEEHNIAVIQKVEAKK